MENAERASRMRAEISKTTKENREFVRNVERAKMLDGIKAKAAKKKISANTETKTATKGGEETSRGERRVFAQVPLAKKRKLDEEQPERVQRVLSKIF